MYPDRSDRVVVDRQRSVGILSSGCGYNRLAEGTMRTRVIPTLNLALTPANKVVSLDYKQLMTTLCLLSFT